MYSNLPALIIALIFITLLCGVVVAIAGNIWREASHPLERVASALVAMVVIWGLYGTTIKSYMVPKDPHKEFCQ